MIEELALRNLRERYAHIHPWIFHRSCGYANSAGELFDILEDIPKNYPIVWDANKRQWIHVADIKKTIIKD
jgi:hypothetical protein